MIGSHICSGGEIGIHEGLKIPWPLGREGSSPSPSTNTKKIVSRYALVLFIHHRRGLGGQNASDSTQMRE